MSRGHVLGWRGRVHCVCIQHVCPPAGAERVRSLRQCRVFGHELHCLPAWKVLPAVWESVPAVRDRQLLQWVVVTDVLPGLQRWQLHLWRGVHLLYAVRRRGVLLWGAEAGLPAWHLLQSNGADGLPSLRFGKLCLTVLHKLCRVSRGRNLPGRSASRLPAWQLLRSNGSDRVRAVWRGQLLCAGQQHGVSALRHRDVARGGERLCFGERALGRCGSAGGVVALCDPAGAADIRWRRSSACGVLHFHGPLWRRALCRLRVLHASRAAAAGICVARGAYADGRPGRGRLRPPAPQ